MNFTALPALAEDIQMGAIWLPSQHIPAGRIVSITNISTGLRVYCEAIPIGDPFRKRYNSRATTPIGNPDACIVLSQWYRQGLGCHPYRPVEISIGPADNMWGAFQASVGHPQIVVRLATKLAVFSVFLGALGAVLGVIGLLK